MSNDSAHERRTDTERTGSVLGTMRFVERDAAIAAAAGEARLVDYRGSSAQLPPLRYEEVTCSIRDARREPSRTTLGAAGFTLIEQPTEVSDWFAAEQVTSRYYEECRNAAKALTGASHAFTFDHLIREPGKQTAGGGLDGAVAVTGPERGGGYVSGVHMDYTTNATWADYLHLHGMAEPQGASQVTVLNMWRPILNSAGANPLAVCDAETVDESDLVETMIYGYGHAGYSWHEIGVGVYEVAASDRHRWYYYPDMTPDETLVFTTYDSAGVVGRTCPHGSFVDPSTAPDAPVRRSIELRVLCYHDAHDA